MFAAKIYGALQSESVQNGTLGPREKSLENKQKFSTSISSKRCWRGLILGSTLKETN